MIDVGKIAYEAYSAKTGHRSAVSGEPLPSWEEQSQEIRDAWQASAEAVLEAHGFWTRDHLAEEGLAP